MSEQLRDLSRSTIFNIGSQSHKTAAADTFAAASAQARGLIGQTVDGKYQILELIGSGGMGCVYLARHVMLDKQVALKTFKSANLSQEQELRFKREAQAIAKLSHVNIVQVFDFGYDRGPNSPDSQNALSGNAVPYFTMESLVGHSLDERLQEVGFIDEQECLKIFEQVFQGLAAAHNKGIIHRDLKPGNIFLQSGSTKIAKIVDFGIAGLSQSNLDEQKLTAVGTVFGSPLYMSPEQSRGERVTALSDIYSCGCTMFQALTGKPPFIGNNAFSTLLMHQNDLPPTLEQCAEGKSFKPELEQLIAQMLAKDPQDRPASAEEVITCLQLICTGKSQAKQNSGGIRANLKKDLSVGEAEGHSTRVKENFGRPQTNDYPQTDTEEQTLKGPPLRVTAREVILAISIIGLSVAGAYYGYMHKKATKAAIEEPIVKPISKQSSLADEPFQDMLKKAGERGSPTDESVGRRLDPGYDHEPQDIENLLKHRPIADRFALSSVYISDATMGKIVATPKIQNISFTDCRINNFMLSELSKLNLVTLTLSESNFDDVGARKLAGLKSLNSLNVEITQVSDGGVVSLARIKNLKRLTIGATSISDAGLGSLRKLKKLEFLNLEGAKEITDDGLAYLINIPLWFIKLENTKTSDAGLKNLAQIKTLRVIQLNRTAVTIYGIRLLCRQLSPGLKIEVQNCPNLPIQAVEKLRREFPRDTFTDTGKASEALEALNYTVKH